MKNNDWLLLRPGILIRALVMSAERIIADRDAQKIWIRESIGALPQSKHGAMYSVDHSLDKETWRCNMWLLRTLSAFVIVSSVMTVDLEAQEYSVDLVQGKTVYERHCQSCHGLQGRGDGPVGAPLKVRPTDFHRFRSFLKSDEELLKTVEHGVVFSPMHSWRGQLTDGEINDVVAYIRLLSQL